MFRKGNSALKETLAFGEIIVRSQDLILIAAQFDARTKLSACCGGQGTAFKRDERN